MSTETRSVEVRCSPTMHVYAYRSGHIAFVEGPGSLDTDGARPQDAADGRRTLYRRCAVIAALCVIGYLVIGLVTGWIFGSIARRGRGEE